MKKSLALATLAAITLAGCATTLPIQSGGIIEKNSGKRVAASESVYNFLGFNPLTLEASEKAITSLQQQCGGGNVTGVTAVARHSFAFFGQMEAIDVSGYCAQ